MKIKSVAYNYETNEMTVSCASKLDLDRVIDIFQKALAEDDIRTLDFTLRPLVAAGRYIDAIKLHRDRTGSSLLASKNYIDSLRGV